MREELLNHPNTILQYQPSIYRNLFFIVHLFVLIGFLFLAFFYPIENRLEYKGYYEDDAIWMLVDEEFFQVSEPVLEMNEEEYSYEVQEIEPASYIDGEVSVWKVSLTMDVKEEWKVSNHQFRLSFLKTRETLFQRLQKFIQKGLRI